MKTKLSEIIKNDKMVIHTPLEEQANTLLKEFDRRGLTWLSVNSYLSYTKWEEYKKDTCYRPSKGMFGLYDDLADNGFQIIEFDDVDFEREPQERTIELDYKSLYEQECKKVDELEKKVETYERLVCPIAESSFLFPNIEHYYISLYKERYEESSKTIDKEDYDTLTK